MHARTPRDHQATGDGWIVVADGAGNASFGGNRAVAIVFFLVFMLSCALVMINLFIAVILENFAETVRVWRRDDDVCVCVTQWVTQ